MNKFFTLILISAISIIPAVLQAQTDLEIALYSNEHLIYPERTDEWIHLGSSLGSEYGDKPFNSAEPGAIGVVQIEPAAYRYFLEHGEYADGTMFLLSFYSAEAESSPQLPGFVQGSMNAQEFHVIDSGRFNEGRGFFLFPPTATPGATSAKVPDGSECVECHMAEAAYNGTFTQFYPTIRHLIGD
ncbi:cytochrome P460 family protein [Gammaproteobacteria bacterium]|nr:cytochrome P460 family protein [Gammaproteobacteria bacterium]